MRTSVRLACRDQRHFYFGEAFLQSPAASWDNPIDSLAPARLALRAVLCTVYPAPSQVHVLPAPSIMIDGEERLKSPARPLNFKRDFLGVVGTLDSSDD